MAENFNAILQWKIDIENSIKLIAECIPMFKPLKQKKADINDNATKILEYEGDIEKMKKFIPEFQTYDATSSMESAERALREIWEKLKINQLTTKQEVKKLEDSVAQYIKYCIPYKYNDDEIIKWLLEKATQDSIEDTEFYAILFIIRNCCYSDNYNIIAKMYSYKAKDQHIVEELMNYDIDALCKYIACQKF